MHQEEVLEFVIKHLSREFEIPLDRINLQSNLFEDLELDSIDALDLASRMQLELNVAPNRQELREIRTVQDVVDYILRNRKETA